MTSLMLAATVFFAALTLLVLGVGVAAFVACLRFSRILRQMRP